MAEVSFKIDGIRELGHALKQLPPAVIGKKGGPLKSAMMTAMLPVLRDAQAKAPVSMGHMIKGEFVPGGRLKRAIKRRRHTNPIKYDEIVGVGVFSGRSRSDLLGAYYAPFVEFGTVKQPPQPFMRPAMEKNRQLIIKKFRTRLAQIIFKEAAKIGAKNAQEIAAKYK